MVHPIEIPSLGRDPFLATAQSFRQPTRVLARMRERARAHSHSVSNLDESPPPQKNGPLVPCCSGTLPVLMSIHTIQNNSWPLHPIVPITHTNLEQN